MNDLGLRLSANWTGIRNLATLGAVLMAFGAGYWCRAATEATAERKARTAAERVYMAAVERLTQGAGDE